MATDWLLSMPQTYAHKLARLLPLTVLPMPFEVPPLDVFMYWHAVHDAAPEHVWFRRVLVESAVVGSGLREALVETSPLRMSGDPLRGRLSLA
jgi:hypothetical protein